MDKKLFPKWKYHKTKPARVVKTKEEESALGHGWENSPAAFPTKDADGEDVAPVKEHKPVDPKDVKKPEMPKRSVVREPVKAPVEQVKNTIRNTEPVKDTSHDSDMDTE